MAVSSGVLKRFIVYLAILTVATFLGWDMLRDYVRQEPGNYDTKRGDQLLTAKDYEEALIHFNLALEESPNHRGALMGRALVFIVTERLDEAIAELDYLIDHLNKTLEPDDKTGIGTLAAAHANRGILYDRRADYERALEDYIESPTPYGAVVAVPHRHVVVFHAIRNLGVVKAISAMLPVAFGMYQEGPGSISPNLYWYRDGKFTLLPSKVTAKEITFLPPDTFVTEVLNILGEP